MNKDTYRNAVDHLEFSGNLYENVVNRALQPKKHTRALCIVAVAMMVTALLASTAFAVSTILQENKDKLAVEHTIPVETMGTAQEEITDAKMMELTVSNLTEGVTVHYMELDPIQYYSFTHGILSTANGGYQRITEDYEFEQIQMQTVNIHLEKNDRVYALKFTYLDTEKGVLSSNRNVYYKDKNGEILLNAFYPPNCNWPVYLNVETGEYRDALPEWTASDFEGQVTYSYLLKGGILVCTLVQNGKNIYNERHWIAPGATLSRRLDIPAGCIDHVYNDTVYYQNKQGHVYVMDTDFKFQLLSEYETNDTLTDGLLTVVTKEGKLGILDVLTGETYVFPSISVKADDLNDLFGYNAIRYGRYGKIGLVEAQTNWETFRTELLQIGVLDLEKGRLNLLTIENEFDGIHNHWLDENRLVVIYKTEDRQFLCIYEFA